MLENTSIIKFRHLFSELWAFESRYLFKNKIKVLKVQAIGTLSKLACVLSKLVAIVMKMVGYTSCELVHDYYSGIVHYL